MSDAPPILAQVLDEAQPELRALVAEQKGNFLQTFGAWVNSAHAGRLEEVFVDAGKARLRGTFAKLLGDQDGEKDASETYQACLTSLKTLGLSIVISAEVEAHAFIQSAMHSILSTLASVLGIAVRAAVAVLVPGPGALLGGLAGTAVEKFLDLVFGV